MAHPFMLRLLPDIHLRRNAMGEITVTRDADTAVPVPVIPAEYVACLNGQPAIGLRPMTVPFRLQYRACDPHTPLRLSRFASLRRLDEHLVWETPLAPARIWCYDARLGALWELLARPLTPHQAAEALVMALPDLTQCLELCVCAGLVAPADATGQLPEDRHPALCMWSPHEALFHARSRLGRHDDPVGTTYRFRGTLPPPPGRRPAHPGPTIALARPSLDSVGAHDVSLTQALETRRSRRAFDDTQPLTLEQLGHFLYRTARVTALHQATTPEHYDVVQHLYPTGGGMGEIEVYVLAAQCQGLERGAYHYDAFDHRLTGLATAPPACLTSLLTGARQAAALTQEPQVLLLCAARLTRSLWKYSAIAYALALKNVGALLQTCALVATAMGLASCPLGAGNADHFATLSRCDYWEEASVGECILGTATASTEGLSGKLS